MNKANFFKEVTVIDPDSNGEVEVSMFKHENGGIFGIDSSWLDQCTDEEMPAIISDPFETNEKVLLNGI